MSTNLTAEGLRERLHYTPETGVFLWLHPETNAVKTGDVAGCDVGRSGKKRYVISLSGRSYRAGRLAWLYITGKWPRGVIDHFDGNYLNQRWGNLRDVTNQVNVQNQTKAPKSNKSSGLLGVTWDKRSGRWRAQIKCNKKNYWLGDFADPETAHQAYLVAKRSLHAGCTI